MCESVLVCVCVSGKALADNINVLVTYPVLLPQLLSVSVCLFALARLTCDFLSLTIWKQASEYVYVCVCLHTYVRVCLCMWHKLAFWFVKSNVQSKWSVIRIRTAFLPLRLPLSASLPLSPSLSVSLSGCQSVCQSVSKILCVCMRGTKTNYTVKCVCLTSNLIKVMLLFRPSTVRSIHNLSQSHTHTGVHIMT